MKNCKNNKKGGLRPQSTFLVTMPRPLLLDKFFVDHSLVGCYAIVIYNGVVRDLVYPCCLFALATKTVKSVLTKLFPQHQSALLPEFIEIESVTTTELETDSVYNMVVAFQQITEFYFLSQSGHRILLQSS